MKLAALAAEFTQARLDGRVADIAGAAELVDCVETAYRVQSEIAARAPTPVRGWKVVAFTPADQRAYRSNRPVAGPLLDPYVHRSPATLSLSRLVAPLIECEIAFVLGSDLPSRLSAYDERAVAWAVHAVVPAIEIADSRIPKDASDLLRLADVMGNGAFITGRPFSDWRGLNLASLTVGLRGDNGEQQTGTSAKILGHPLRALAALANAQPLPLGGLRKGQIITTGSCTPPVPLRPGSYVADFGALGEVRLTVTD